MIKFLKNLFKKRNKPKKDNEITVEEYKDGVFITCGKELSDEKLADIAKDFILKQLKEKSMSNIGFMQSSVKNIERLYKYYINHPKQAPSRDDKKQYLNLIDIFTKMYANNEFEDKELFEILMKKMKNNDLTTLSEFKKKLRRTRINMNGRRK